jgi:hypothetical protein
MFYYPPCFIIATYVTTNLVSMFRIEIVFDLPASTEVISLAFSI